MAGWTIRIYGCDNQVGIADNEQPLKTAVEGLTGETYVEYTGIYGMYPEIETEGDTVEYANGFTTTIHQFRNVYNIEVALKQFPSSATTFETFYDTAVFNKRYHWLWFNDFPIVPSGIDNTKVQAIAITGIATEHKDGAKYLTIQCKNRERL